MNSQSIPNQRLPYIDIVKTIALILIVYSHTAHCYGQVYLGSFFIAAFFLMSGYTYKPILSWKTYLAKRTKRLLIPYFFFNVIFIILCRHFSLYDILGIFYSRFKIDIVGESMPVMLRSLNGPLWFFTAMFLTDILFIGVIKITDFKKKNKLIHFFIIFILLVTSFLLNQVPLLLPWSLDMVPFFTLFMYLGHLCFRYNMFDSLQGWKMILAVIVLIVACKVNGSINLSIRVYGQSILLCLLTGTLGTFLLVWMGKSIENTAVGCFLAAVGKHTLTIFSLQMFVLHFVNSTISFVGYDGTQTMINILLGFVAVVIVFVIGKLTSVVLKRLVPSVF